MVYGTHHIKLPYSNAKIRTMNGSFVGSGAGAVLLDGGIGGQSSYRSLDDYIETTNKNPYASSKSKPSGAGLADKIGHKLSKLNLMPQTGGLKKKNIVMSV